MNTNLYNLLKYINDYSNQNVKCPTYREMAEALNTNYDKAQELCISAYRVGMLKPKRVRNRKRFERNWLLTEAGLNFLKTATCN